MRYLELLQLQRADFARAFGVVTVASSATAAVVVPRTPRASAVALLLHWQMCWSSAEPAVVVFAREASGDLMARHRSERGLYDRATEAAMAGDALELTPEQARTLWDALARSAMHLDSAGAVPSSADLAWDSLGEAVAELPGRVAGAVRGGVVLAVGAGVVGLLVAFALARGAR